MFESSWKVDFHQLVAALFRIYTRHDCQIYRFPQRHKVSIALILNFQCLLLLLVLIVFAIVAVVLISLFISAFS